MAGLPDTVKQLPRAGSRMDELPIDQILSRSRAALTDEVCVAAAAHTASFMRCTDLLMCFHCAPQFPMGIAYLSLKLEYDF